MDIQKPVLIVSVQINGEYYDKKTAKFMMLSGVKSNINNTSVRVNDAEKDLKKLKV